MPIAANIYFHLHEGSPEGQKPPVVLLHGAGGTRLYWPPEVRRLPGHRVYALDLPGHGKSTGYGVQTIPAYAQAIVEWLGAVGLHSAVFVGHSMGSAIALCLALDHTEHVLGLGLVGAGARLRVAPEILACAADPATLPSAVAIVASWSFSPQASPRLVELAAQRMGEARPSVLYGDFLACNAFNEMERISQIRQPALVICGEDDRMTPLRFAQYLADHIPHAVLKAIPSAGHMVMLEQPRAVADALGEFLGGISY
jgi:pimeloyl-ACP methyl ester carboxylesterase